MKTKIAVVLAVLIGTLPAFALPPPGGRPGPSPRPAPVRVVHRAAPRPAPAPRHHHDGPSRGLANALAITGLVATSLEILSDLGDLFAPPRQEVIVVPAQTPAQNVVYVPAGSVVTSPSYGSTVQVVTVPAR